MKKIIGFNIINICEKGGEERICTMLANHLADLGYEIHIISFYANNGLTPFYYISNKIRLHNLLPNSFERFIHFHFGWLEYAQRKYERYIKKNDIDLIIDVATVRSPFTTPIAQKLGIKHIAWDHFCYRYFLEHPSRKRILPCLQKGIDKLVLLTDKDVQNYTCLAKVPSEKVVRIYNFSAIEEEDVTPHNSNVVLAMGRLHKQKGFDLLLDAWAIVETKNKEWKLEIVGDGPERINLLRQIEKLQLQRVTISPATSNPKSKYEKASIFALPSRVEGLGLTLIEACYMSLPVVAFSCPNGPLELLEDGKTGLLVPEKDTKSMADKLVMLMNDTKLRTSIGTAAFKSIQEINKNKIVLQWKDLIDSMFI